jgi:hypothetical protein
LEDIRLNRGSGRVLSGQRDRGFDVIDVGLLVGNFCLEAESAQIVSDEEGAIKAVVMIEDDLCVLLAGTVGVNPKSKPVSSTIMPPKSPPTYQAPLRASAGVASTVDDSATTMASFRINLPLSSASQAGTT